MKHVMIITYSFAPANMMAAHRNFLRAKGLDELGVRVSVVTRAWAPGQSGMRDGDRSPAGISVEPLFRNAKVYRVPYGPGRGETSFVEKFFLKILGLSKGVGLWRRIWENVAYFFLPLEYAFRLNPRLKDLESRLDSPPDFVLASGDPWSNFALGRRLADHFGAKFIAEYRDPWNYRDPKFRVEGFNTYNRNPVSQLKRFFSIRRERKINADADLIIAASQPFLENALAMTGVKKGMVVTNGFDRAEIDTVPRETYGAFTLSYVGTIYSQQKSDIFFRAMEALIDKHRIPLDAVRIKLVGSKHSHGFEKTMESIKACRHHESIVELLDRLDKPKSLQIQKSSGVLLYFAHRGTVGVFPGKIFEYIAMGVPILLVPSDHDVAERLILETGTGTICNDEKETLAFLERAYFDWKKTGAVAFNPDRSAIEKYSYRSIASSLYEKMVSL